MRALAVVWNAVFCAGAAVDFSLFTKVAPFGLIHSNLPWFPSKDDISCQTLRKWIFFSFEGLALEISEE